MKKIIPVCLLLLTMLSGMAQGKYWQQELNYTIDVKLNDKEHSLDGFMKLQYTNHSPDTLFFIWFHLWPNAYKNDKTAFSDQLLQNGDISFYFSKNDQRGYINRLDFRVNGSTAQLEDHPEHIDIAKLILPTPLPPGASASIHTPFHVQLPDNFSRGGHNGQSYAITQWYPKPAVYDRKGWHPMPYLDQGEFYSEFGTYDVQISLPRDYVVGATGSLKNDTEKTWLKEKAKNPKLRHPGTEAEKTLRYSESRVHDFAWFADKQYQVSYDTLALPSGKVVELFNLYLSAKHKGWQQSISYSKAAIQFYSAKLGEYPYAQATVAEGKSSFGGGMEYPTITLITGKYDEDGHSLNKVIAHELGHNWFYGILASNERTHPWMDEGMNSFYDNWYNQTHIAPKKGKGLAAKFNEESFEEMLLQNNIAERRSQAIDLKSDEYTAMNYGLVAYHKAASWMALLKKEMGDEVFHKMMQTYFNEWQFKHPYPEDFKALAERVSGKNLDALFARLHDKEALQPAIKKKIKPAFLFDLRETDKYQYISFLPFAGYNITDKLMPGLLVHNWQIPQSRLRFTAAPMYSTGAGKLVGFASVDHNSYPKSGLLSEVKAGLHAAMFSTDQFKPLSGNVNINLAYRKISPYIKLSFRNKSLLSHKEHSLEARYYSIREDELRFARIITGTDTQDVVNKEAVSRSLGELTYRFGNRRKLYPYNGIFRAELGRDFARLGFTGNYYFQYNAVDGGLNLRLFAGKFIYLGGKTLTKQFETDRYHLNLTGPKGYEDYAYNNTFLGRNEFEGLANQQIMQRDGYFKLRTDLLSSKIGKTDDWLAAINLTSDIPKKLNPLSVLPVKIPIKLFFDLGTYREAWDADASGSRFLFDGGIQLSLLAETVNIFVPLVYSKLYANSYFKTIPEENKLSRKISFSIDLDKLDQLLRNPLR